MKDSSLHSGNTVSRRQLARLAVGLSGVIGLGAAGISSVRAKHGDDDWGDDDWVQFSSSVTPESLAAVSGVTSAPSVVTGDLSFISLALVLPAVRATMAPGGDAVLLIKPQFEVGRTSVRGGLVTDPASRADAVAGVLWAAWDAGLGTHGVVASPPPGTHGNHEFVAWLRGRDAEDGGTDADASNPSAWLAMVNELTQR